MSRPTYDEIYSKLSGMVALQTAAETKLKRLPDEKDTAFVKRIVATYLAYSGQPDALLLKNMI